MSGLVLTVDDNELNLKLISRLLTIEGHDVITATTGPDAIALALERHPQLILMDVDLPGMDGLEATRRLKSDPRTTEVPVIAVSAYAMASDRARALDAGCVDYVTKPLDTRLLGRVVALHLPPDGDRAA
jgi:CheY-like chemotaxis protein